jgi:hypothetical protein
MGTELSVEGDPEPVFEIDDDIESAIEQVGGWSYLLHETGATLDYTGFVVPADRLSLMADLCEVLAEQYGNEGRTFVCERPASFNDDPRGTNPRAVRRPLPITGPELGRRLHEMAEAVRSVAPLDRSLRVDNGGHSPPGD